MRYIKSEAGQQAWKDRSPAMSLRQRSGFVMFDGKRSLSEVMASTPITQQDVEEMASLGFIVAMEPPSGASPPARVVEEQLRERLRFERAYALAVELTADLGINGLSLNLEVEAVQTEQELLDLLPRLKSRLPAPKYATLERTLASR